MEEPGSGGGEDLERSRCDENEAAERELRRKEMFSRDLGSNVFPFEVPPSSYVKRTSGPGERIFGGWKMGERRS